MFEKLNALPADPILGLMSLYRQDSNPDKVDLGVGVYKDEQGKTPILASVKAAEKRYYDLEESKAYIGPAGAPGFNAATQSLLFGAVHPVLAAGRAVTVQTPGGCGALRVAAELIKRCNAGASVWVSDPSWANHVPLLGSAGLQIRRYPYYDYGNNTIRFDEMLETLKQVKAGDLVLLHACCHNPCGADLTREQWRAVAQLAAVKGFTPFIDMAYQGFGEGLEEDAYGLRLIAETVPELVVASSCSKNFGLYRERVGSVSITSADAAQAAVVQSQLVDVIRGIYSMPPSHGGALVELILKDAQLHHQWQVEVAEMRNRINSLRCSLVERLNEKGAAGRFDFIRRQRGMFSFLGITPEQVERLQREYSIYMVNSSRINIAGICQANLDYLVESVMAVI